MKEIEKWLRPPLRPMPYQIAWLNFFLSHPTHGGVYADDMGLGKTFSVWLAVFAHNPPGMQGKKTLLVANNQAVMNQWVDELHKFFRNVKDDYAAVWSADDRWTDGAQRDFDDAQVILTTKDTLVSDFQGCSPYWLSDHSQNKADTSYVMFSPVDGEPNPKADPKLKPLSDRRKNAKRDKKKSKLYLDEYGKGIFSFVFVDEGDLLRAEGEHLIPGQIRKRSYQACWHLFCDKTWILTGTPINNNAIGLLSLFELCRCDPALPERVQGLTENSIEGGTPLSFMQKVRRLDWDNPAAAQMEALRTLQRSCCLRRVIDSEAIRSQNASAGRPLPICKYVDIPVTVGDDEDIYMSTVETNTTAALRTWLKLDEGERYNAWSNVWTGMTQSRRVAALNPRIGLQRSGTADYYDYVNYPLSEKEKVIVRICQAAVAKGEQVVIATLFVECNERLVATLARYNIMASRFDGQVKQDVRQENMAKFQDNEADVLVMLMFAGGRGLNLQNANHLILTSPWWNPVVLDQTRRRVWRVGSPHKVVTVYNVFYDITVEQWMLQTRIKTKVQLAAAVMNEEGMYGGEEAITTAKSKGKLSSTLDTEREGMWDFLSFLRAAPTAREEIRSVQDKPWSLSTLLHPLLGPRCIQLIVATLLALKRASVDGRLKTLPVQVIINIFSFLLSQDFAAVPEQDIAYEIEIADEDQRALEDSQGKLQDIATHITNIDKYLTDVKKKRDSSSLTKEEEAVEEDVKKKQAQLYQARAVLEGQVSRIRHEHATKMRLAREEQAKLQAARARKAARRKTDNTGGLSLTGGGGGGGASASTSNAALDLGGAGQLDSTGLSRGRGGGGGGGSKAKRGGGSARDEDDGGIRFLDDSDDDNDSLLSDGDGLLDEDEEEADSIKEPLDAKVQAQLRSGVMKYLSRKPMTRTQLVKKLKATLELSKTETQQKLSQNFLTNELQSVAVSVMIEDAVHWKLNEADGGGSGGEPAAAAAASAAAAEAEAAAGGGGVSDGTGGGAAAAVATAGLNVDVPLNWLG